MDSFPKKFTIKNPIAKKWIDSQKDDKFCFFEFLIHSLGSNGRDSVINWNSESTNGKGFITCGDFAIAKDGVTKIPKEV